MSSFQFFHRWQGINLLDKSPENVDAATEILIKSLTTFAVIYVSELINTEADLSRRE